MEQSYRYDRVAITLHWLIAVLILVNIGIGLGFPDPLPGQRFSPKPLLPLHISIGISVLLLSLARLAWRLTHRPPPYRWPLPNREHLLARAGHWAFYGLMILMPLTGWMAISAHKVQKTPLRLFGLHWPHFPVFPMLPAVLVDRLHDLLVIAHAFLTAWLMPALLALHVAAIAKHHLIDRKPLLGRMLGGK
ncbi:cytochrome b [Sphingomonas sp.]|uniref:cytochrome b n=1 Tax=Sphingomonas sp. TaxID=28214 RepID=UPI000DB4E4C0|nr:cytochrome b [Sphingomonas sp.]PZU10993.1 MAG: cytochrome B [Sphingomonas sp.]